jgi:hypothetical protein
MYYLNLREHLKKFIFLFARYGDVLIVAHHHVAAIATGEIAHVPLLVLFTCK